MTNPTTERPKAPATETEVVIEQPAPPPPPKTLERQGDKSEPYTRRLPQVRGGVCEYCGILDKNTPSQYQYKLCPHFRDIGQLRCTYCDGTKDPDEVVSMSTINVAEHPDTPNTWIAWCDRYECSRKHAARFKRS